MKDQFIIRKISLISTCFLFMLSCEKETSYRVLNDARSFDIILIAGQSNTDSGTGLDLATDTTGPNILQLGRFGDNNWNVIEAVEPLDNHDKNPVKIGFSLTFANQYVSNGLLKEGRYLLLVPCGYGGTGFKDRRWNKGNDLYNDAMNRVNYVLRGNADNKVVAILWHQGEQDVDWMTDIEYQKALDKMVGNMRNDIISNGDSIPFILGGMVPFWIAQETIRADRQKVLIATPNRIDFCGYADPTQPFVLSKSNDWDDMIHYNAIQQRELGKRYFKVFLEVENSLEH